VGSRTQLSAWPRARAPEPFTGTWTHLPEQTDGPKVSRDGQVNIDHRGGSLPLSSTWRLIESL